MAVGFRLCWCLFFALALLASARNTISLSGEALVEKRMDMEMEMEGRSLKVTLDDYRDASANKGHDPNNKPGIGGGNGGRKPT